MIQALKQTREDTRVRIYTPEYRIYGHLHLVPGRSTADLLNLEQRDVVPVTQAQLFSPGWIHPPEESELRGRTLFLGLNRIHIMWVLGGRPTVVKSSAMKDIQLSLLFPAYLLSGVLTIPSGARVTDFLHATRAFQSLTDVSLCTLDEDLPLNELQPKARFEFVTVNMLQAVGVIEH